MNTPQESCGLFGKIPQQSDFVTHHLPESFIEHWHHWLQSCLSISREQRGDDWMQGYMVSPVWHFALMPGIISDKSVVGVMIPNVDQVGRYFPSIIAHVGDHDVWSAYLEGNDWFQQAEKIALLSLADETTYSQLIGELESMPTPEFEALPQYSTQASMQVFKGNQVVQKKAEQSHSELATSLLPKAIQHRYGNHSLWWTEGSEIISPSLAISSDLPDPGQYAAMLDGNWQQWGWAEEAILETADEPA